MFDVDTTINRESWAGTSDSQPLSRAASLGPKTRKGWLLPLQVRKKKQETEAHSPPCRN